MGEFKKYESETAVGVKAIIQSPCSDLSAQMVLITESEHNVAVPYFYINSYCDENGVNIPYTGLNRDKEEMELQGAFLKELVLAETEIVTADVKKWATAVLENADSIEHNMQNSATSSFYVGDEYDGSLVAISPVLLKPEMAYKEATRNDVEYWLTDDNVVSSDSSIYKLAVSLTNYEALINCLNKDKQELQHFYEEEIMPILDIPYENKTEEQKDLMGHFSDWYKDIYGRRPDNNNICAKNVDKKAKKADVERE